MTVAEKVYKKVLLNQIYEPTDNILHPFQTGLGRVETVWNKFIY